jgi:nucleotide-binding universal stress UspA family protein
MEDVSDQMPEEGPAPHRMVVGVDGSECATRALDYAADEAHRTGAVLQVVSVCSVVPAAGMIVAPGVLDEPGAEDVVRRATERVRRRRPDVVTKGEIVFGAAGPVLVDMSEDAELLVVGTRGHSQVVDLLLGSVSEEVVHHAHCTTTVVR